MKLYFIDSKSNKTILAEGDDVKVLSEVAQEEAKKRNLNLKRIKILSAEKSYSYSKKESDFPEFFIEI